MNECLVYSFYYTYIENIETCYILNKGWWDYIDLCQNGKP